LGKLITLTGATLASANRCSPRSPRRDQEGRKTSRVRSRWQGLSYRADARNFSGHFHSMGPP